MKRILFLSLFLFFSVGVFAQTETLTNADIIEMTRAGLGKQVILQKIEKSQTNFDASKKALIELKAAGVDDEIIVFILEKGEVKTPLNTVEKGWSENVSLNENALFDNTPKTPKEALRSAKTVAIMKSSLSPSRQALEKALFKRAEWKKYNLTIVRYKESADIYIEIGRIPFSWVTHRYVFRVFDRRSGAIITAGETTSWGSLAENLAREITQKLDAVSAN